MKFLTDLIRRDKVAQLTTAIFLLLTIWWILIFLGGAQDAPANHIFGFIYGGFSLWGGIWGLYIAKDWGGGKSLMGKAILGLALGLLSQAFGQYTFWYYNFALRIPLPYPGIPDIGYFGTIPLYIYAALLLSKASGVKVSLRSFANKIQAVVIPAIMLIFAYLLFFHDYEFDFSQPLKIFFDFGYPMGQAIYISIAILTYSLARNVLGGVMKNRIFFLILAFFAQFLADYIFIYFQEQYFPASFIDYFYLLAYFLMTLGLLQLKTTLIKTEKL